MRISGGRLAAVAGVLLIAGCLPDGDERCGDGFYYADASCYAVDTDTSTGDPIDTDTIIDPDNWIGAACSCSGDECENTGVPVPHAGAITGCGDVPADWTGALRTCLRSYVGNLSFDTYFANGYCSLGAAGCTGSETICGFAAYGDYTDFTTCPEGSVLLDAQYELEVMSLSATVDNKTCALGCADDGDCRTGEEDPVLEETTQYQCIDKDGVKFCYDPRTLPADYSAEAF